VKNQQYQLETLPAGAVVGTSSLRRLAQLRHSYPHLTFKDVRGNVITRLAKLDAGEYDALILAAAGLGRLDLADRIHQLISPEISLHAVGQGALGIECRDGDTEVLEVLQALQHQPTAYRCWAERAFLKSLEGGCQVPIGVNTSIVGDQLTLVGMVATLDGKTLIKNQITGAADQAEQLGQELATMLCKQGAREILDEIFALVGRDGLKEVLAQQTASPAEQE
jgi:hydroxymethylbilane synthase